MVGTLRHRGPDDSGLFVDGPAALGAARLSIIDVAGGHQPISIDGGAITVAQNGEIYNYVELMDELKRAGRTFTTACDTEVIAHLYATEGVDGFRKMRGMFAVAIWDAPRQRLVLARDRVGKKPLYYYSAKQAISCSDPRPRRFWPRCRTCRPSIRRRCSSFFTFGYVAGDGAVFDGMRRLTPGSALVLDARSGSQTVEPFWEWPEAPARDSMPEGEAIERLRAELTEAVRIRLRSDVPLGAFLSGGMDSAAVLALMTALTRDSGRCKTFTIGFGDPAYDELDAARATAAHFGADHHEQIVTPDCVRVAETLAVHYDEPFADASAIPTFYVAELARRHVTVCLTRRRRRRAVRRLHAVRRRARPRRVAARRRDPQRDRRGRAVHPGARARQGTPVDDGARTRSLVRLAPHRVSGLPARSRRRSAMSWPRRRRLPERQAVADIRDALGHPAVAPAAVGSAPLPARRHPGQSRSRHDGAFARGALPAARSSRDRTGRRAVVGAARGRTTTKRLFREVIRPWVPADVLTRPKRGFGVPLRRWFQEQMIGWARDILLDPRTPAARMDAAGRSGGAAQQHENGARDHAKRIWALVCLELWARTHVDRAASAAERAAVRVTMLVRCLAMMRGGGETRHLAWAQRADGARRRRGDHHRRPLLFGAARYPCRRRSRDGAAVAVRARLRLPVPAPPRVRTR